MVADKGKKSKVSDRIVEDDADHIDGELVLSIEKLQELQDELEKVRFSPLCCFSFVSWSSCLLLIFVAEVSWTVLVMPKE